MNILIYKLYHKYIKYKAKYINLKQIQKYLFTNMYSATNSLLKSNNMSFVFVDLNFNDNDQELVNSILITNVSDTLEYYGILDRITLKNLLRVHISQIGNDINKSTKIANLLLDKIIEPYLKATDKNYLWFKMQVIPPNNLFDIPRWHTDGYFYDSKYYADNNLPQTKLAGVLKGESTLFKENDNEMRNIYRETWESSFVNGKYDPIIDMENRKILDEKLVNYNTLSVPKNHAAIFIVGSKDKSAVHSEPRIKTMRLFYSIVSGTKNEIADLAKNWNKIFNA